MIDFDDADEIVSDGFWVGGKIGVLLIIIGLILYAVAISNQKDCQKTMKCENGGTVELIDHQCRCLAAAVPVSTMPPEKEYPSSTRDHEGRTLP